MSVAVYFSPAIDPETILPFLNKQGINGRIITEYLSGGPETKLLILEQDYLKALDSTLLESAAALLLLVQNESELQMQQFPDHLLVDYCISKLNQRKLQNLIESLLLRQQLQKLSIERDSYMRRLKELNSIGIALSTERDPVKLLNMILQKSREITFADAGSLYLVEGEEDGTRRLRFKISQNDTLPVNYEEFVLPITKGSVSGYVASTGDLLNIPDVYNIAPEEEYSFNRNYDESTGYRSVSMLVVPMKNHSGEIIGIIQLINRKKDFSAKLSSENYLEQVQPFSANDEDLVNSLASQAAVALENSILIKSIQRLFEGFVTASVTAIESRDPTTSGHSFRVANLTVGLAQLVNDLDHGKFREIRFHPSEIKELRYAALLHDFGKVGVRENVLVKAKKLYPVQIDLIKERFNYLKKFWEAEMYKSKLNLFMRQGAEDYDHQVKELDSVFRKRLDSLEDYLQFIMTSNEPTVLPEGNFEKLLRLTTETDLLPPGYEGKLLSPEEAQLLSIRKGNLNDRERTEIESHVTHTFLFLSKIPWTSELKQVPRIAFGHHEKLDGSGYPNRLKGDDIPIQTRMMTISDIYDALTAADRPYKRAVPPNRALDILQSEVRTGQLDNDLFQLFVDARIFELSTGRKG